jgi:hypothetical protein
MTVFSPRLVSFVVAGRARTAARRDFTVYVRSSTRAAGSIAASAQTPVTAGPGTDDFAAFRGKTSIGEPADAPYLCHNRHRFFPAWIGAESGHAS